MGTLARRWPYSQYLHLAQTWICSRLPDFSPTSQLVEEKGRGIEWDVTKLGGGVNIRVTFPYSNLLMKGEKLAEKWQRRAAFCGEGNSADRSGRRLSFQHHNRPDSAAVGISLNMINVGMCLENVFRPLHSTTSDLQNYTQDKCAFSANKLYFFFLSYFDCFARLLFTLLYLNLHYVCLLRSNCMNIDF